MKNKKKTQREREIDLAYLARKMRLVNPVGTFDNGGRWYPDVSAEGGTPYVRSPSRAYPYSYILGCRTRKWCEQLPVATRKHDAAIAKNAIESERIVRDENGKWTFASVPAEIENAEVKK